VLRYLSDRARTAPFDGCPRFPVAANVSRTDKAGSFAGPGFRFRWHPPRASRATSRLHAVG
jgi:hypothetical protein